MRSALAALTAWLLLALAPDAVLATEELAARTGKECGHCHIASSGGGALTAAGEAFASEAGLPGTAKAPSGRRLVRFIAGYVHLFTAVLWFGTILYVHLLLKPAYAARGLPKGELFVGWLSIVLIAVTGTILTVLRIPSVDALYRTRFGILLSIKILIYLVMTATAVIVTFVIGPRLKAKKEKVDLEKRDLTAEELGRFTGKEGVPAYFAYRGTIYDATGSRLWKKGVHVGKHQAGFDLTDALKLAPHGEENLQALPVVGRLVESAGPVRPPAHLRAFIFMTYLNLVLILGVLLTIALWRWW